MLWMGVVRVGGRPDPGCGCRLRLDPAQHAILRNFPVIGHLRYLLESVGPELRQYIVTDNRQERPFDRDQRRWIYTSAKGINNNFGFGSDEDLDAASGHIIIDQSMFPLPRPDPEEIRSPAQRCSARPGSDPACSARRRWSTCPP